MYENGFLAAHTAALAGHWAERHHLLLGNAACFWAARAFLHYFMASGSVL